MSAPSYSGTTMNIAAGGNTDDFGDIFRYSGIPRRVYKIPLVFLCMPDESMLPAGITFNDFTGNKEQYSTCQTESNDNIMADWAKTSRECKG